MIKRRYLYVGSGLVLVMLLAFAVVKLPNVTAASIGSEAPFPANSTPDNAHTFLLRRSSNWGKNPAVQLVAYYHKDTSTTQWGNAYLQIRPGGGLNQPLVCQTNSAGLSGSELAKYITVRLEVEGGESESYQISYARACNYDDPTHENDGGVAPTNQLFGRYPIPGDKPANTNPTTRRYHVNITISYHDNLEPNVNNTGNTAQFDIKGNTELMKIGQLGGRDESGDGTNFPIVTDYWYTNSGRSDEPTQINIPFGLPCDVGGSEAISKKIGIYDSDNGSPAFDPLKVKFRVKNQETNQYLQFIANSDVRGDFQEEAGVPRRVFKPDDGEADYSYARMNFMPQTKYVMEIFGLADRNIIDIHVPGDTIYGDIECGWKMTPHSETTGATIVPPGATVTFKHTATNTGNNPTSGEVRAIVRWGKGGANTSNAEVDRIDRTNYDAGQDRNKDTTFTIPMTAADNTQYCQYIEITPRSNKDSSSTNSWDDEGDRACYTVRRTPTVPEEALEVQVTPSVSASSPEIEPTEPTSFGSMVSVTSFPRATPGGWSFYEYSAQGNPTRESPNSSGGLETQVDTEPVIQTTTYSCPHPNDYKRVGSTCYHEYQALNTKSECQSAGHQWNGSLGSGCRDTHAASSSTNYTCPSGYTRGGYAPYYTCSQTQYRCEGGTTWSSTKPSCPITYSCASGASLDWSAGSPPKCNGWKCPYQNNFVRGGTTAPTCEFRCNGGSGAVAVNGSGTTRSPCYQQPSFTLSCQWSGGRSWSQTVTTSNASTSTITSMCVDTISKTGVAIGTDVCSTLIAYQPGAWTSNEPGWGSRDNGATWGWINHWAWGTWTSKTAQACTEVVGRPTFKVFGGDVSAGQAFARNLSCDTVPTTASIAGWPRSNGGGYDAAYGQLGAFASGTITGFATAKYRSGNAAPPSGLAFANTGTAGERFGGGFSKPYCINDYNYDKPALTTLSNLNNLNGASASGSYSSTGGRINNNLSLSRGQRITVYATGDVTIGGNSITYGDRTTWLQPSDIAAFRLIVYGGNIYIENSVTALNGTFVAQPNTAGTGGNIYTCAQVGAAYGDNRDLFNNCSNQLTVNGAFIARKVHLLRTPGTAIRGETAERFNYLPEIWTAPWPSGTTSTSQLKYDAMLSLPPVL